MKKSEESLMTILDQAIQKGELGDMRPKIMIADDEPMVREVIREALERMGKDYEIVIVKDGGEALNSIMEGSYDLLITDIQMPVLDGLKLSTVIRALGKKVMIIWISGFGFHELQDEIVKLRIHSIMEKPVKVGEIRSKVQAALGQILP